MKKYIFHSQFQVMANSQEEAYQELMRHLTYEKESLEVQLDGSEFIEEQD